MKLAPAIEEFIQYKQALGSPYSTSSRVLKAFLRKTGNVEFDELTEQHAAAFLPGRGATVTSAWFHYYRVLGCFFRFASSRGYVQHRILPASIPDRPPRFIPYIYSTEDMRRLLGVPDSHYPPASPLSPDTMRTLVLVLSRGGRLNPASPAFYVAMVSQRIPSNEVPVKHDNITDITTYLRLC